jgi:transposase
MDKLIDEKPIEYIWLIIRGTGDETKYYTWQRWHGLSGRWRRHLHEEIEHLVGKEKNHLVGLSFISEYR